MKIGMVGLGRMGAAMARRIIDHGHECVAYDRSKAAIEALSEHGASTAYSLDELVGALSPPRVIWMMVPAAAVDGLTQQLAQLLQPGDTLIDGGNSHYKGDIARAASLSEQDVTYLDVGTSGGVWGLQEGYCLMVGGDRDKVDQLEPLFDALAPGADTPRTPGREGRTTPAERGWLHCGPAGAGHFVKMVHNGIEYGIMAAYAEGLNILRHAGVGRRSSDEDAETAPLADPAAFDYQLPLADVAEVWRHGSVIRSWLLDLAAEALYKDPELEGFAGRVSDSGEGRWTAIAAVESGVPAPVLTTALFNRFASRGEDDFANQILSAMRLGFGGHHERGA